MMLLLAILASPRGMAKCPARVNDQPLPAISFEDYAVAQLKGILLELLWQRW